MCSVVGCDSECRGAQRFKLPEDPERRLEWVQFLFEVNRQRLKESSCTDITICSEHFTGDCFISVTPSGTVQLGSSAVPSLCIKSEPEEPEPHQEYVENTHVAFQYDQLKSPDSPSSYSEESPAAQESPVPSDTSDASMYDYGQMLQKVANIDMIREKAALLQMKGKYVVNETRLLQLFSCKCPLCGSKVKIEKVTYGVLIMLNQQCLQCEYRNQWKSQVNASVPTSEDQHLMGRTDVTPLIQQAVSTDDDHSRTTGVSEIVAVVNEESDPMEETEEEEEGDMDSDEEWKPVDELLLENGLLSDETGEESENDDDPDDYSSKHSELCTDCGKFFNKWKPHTCEHKIKPYSCNVCGKKCVNEAALNSHSRIHDENYEHRCKYCNVTFKTKVDKHTHEQTHITEGKPYKCPDCSETFATNKERKIHSQGHGGQMFKCRDCGMEFTRLMPLQRHLTVHTGERPFKCSVCQRGFNQASHLKSHVRLHTGERPFKCQHCDKCFNHNVSLKSHVQRYHSSNSGHGQKTAKKSGTVSDAADARESGTKKGLDSGLDHVDGEQDEEDEIAQKERTHKPKRKRRSTGRPRGRPKRNTAGDLVLAGEMQGQCSNTKTARVKVRPLKRKRHSGKESEPTESDVSVDSTEEEEERSEKATSSTSGSRGRAKNSDSDSDFDPENSKKKKQGSQNSGKHTGRPRKKQTVEDIKTH